MNHEQVINDTRDWVVKAVIGLNLCPFAKAVHVNERIRYVVSDATEPEALLQDLARELLALSAWRVNDAAAARQWLDMIAMDGETPPGLRSRAEALQALLPAVAKS